MVYKADELCKRATGQPLKPEYFTNYIDNKYKKIYNFK